VSQAEVAGIPSEAASKIFTPYGGLENNFKFLKEVKIM